MDRKASVLLGDVGGLFFTFTIDSFSIFLASLFVLPMKIFAAMALLILALGHPTRAHAADTFGTGPDSFDIPFVTIGNPGNVADTTGSPNPAGSVGEIYRIGKFEISEGMLDKANAASASSTLPLNITHSGRGPQRPATSISWLEATQFVNWLNTSTGNTPAYKFDGAGNFQLWQAGDVGFDASNLYRNSEAQYFLPSLDEWYKAAYFDPNGGVYYDYPTGSDTAPVPVASGTLPGTAVYANSFATGPAEITQAGGLSPYGTIGQGGNAYEWEETDFDLVNDSTTSFRGLRGGTWSDNDELLSSSFRAFLGPTFEISSFGFRVASKVLPGDFDNDDDIDGADFLIWQRGGSPSPLSNADLDAWKAGFGNNTSDTSPLAVASTTTVTSVPEPSSLLLALFAALGHLLNRRPTPFSRHHVCDH